MSGKVQVNFRVYPETVERLEKLCKLLFRDKGDMSEFLVAKEFEARYRHRFQSYQ